MKKPILIVSAAVVVFLLLPYVLKDRTPSRLVAPDLSELRYTEVSFRNGQLSLSGLLFLPRLDEPCPAVVFIDGSGRSRRNSPWYLAVAQRLQENGVAVLRPDKRGCGKSQGDWQTATFEDLAIDAAAAIDYLKHQTTFERSVVGVMGFSQGGWIAPIAYAEAEGVDFVVSMSGPAVTTDEQLSYEVVNDIKDFGTYSFVAKLIAPLGVMSVKRSAYWRVIGGFDPMPYWRKVDVPAFLAFGQNDKNAPVEASVQRIQALGKHNISVKVYPQGGHGIIDPTTHRVQEAFLRDLVSFVRSVKPAAYSTIQTAPDASPHP